MMTPEEMALAARKYFARRQDPADRSASSKATYEVLFDSDAAGPSGGIRNSVVAARQLLFRVGPVFVDMEVGREADSNQASLIGQMLDSSNPAQPPVGVPVTLLDRGKRVASTLSNDHGEFQLRFAARKNLKLSVAFDREHPVQLPITSPPGKTSAGRVKRYKPLGSLENRAIAV